LCRQQQINRGKFKNLEEKDVNEHTPDLVQALISRLETSSEVIEDLKAVLDQVGLDFDRDKAYTEGVFNTGPNGSNVPGQGSRKTIVNSSMGMVNQGGAAIGGGLNAGATGKLAGGKSKKIASSEQDHNKSSKSGMSHT
jgi:hypothetical protein